MRLRFRGSAVSVAGHQPLDAAAPRPWRAAPRRINTPACIFVCVIYVTTSHLPGKQHSPCPSPRIVYLSKKNRNPRRKKNRTKPLLARKGQSRQHYENDVQETTTYEEKIEDFYNWGDHEDEECVYVDWPKTHPACNNVHEFVSSPDHLSFLTEGSESSVFLLTDKSQSLDLKLAVVKKIRWNKLRDEWTNKRRQIDSFIVEHLTSSPYVMSNYGFCGTTVLSPRAKGSLYDLITSIRNGGQEPSPLDKLRISLQVAEGVAAMHAAGMAHNDLDISQHIYHDGKFCLNDFNWGILLRRDPKSLIPCRSEKYAFTPYFFMAPEYLARKEPIRLDTGEVFNIGAEIFILLTKQWMWEGEQDREKCKRLTLAGERPPLPKNIAESNDRAVKILIKALYMCWEHDPAERKSAREIAVYLRKGLQRMSGDEETAEVTVALPPLIEGRPNDADCYTKYMSAFPGEYLGGCD